MIKKSFNCNIYLIISVGYISFFSSKSLIFLQTFSRYKLPQSLGVRHLVDGSAPSVPSLFAKRETHKQDQHEEELNLEFSSRHASLITCIKVNILYDFSNFCTRNNFEADCKLATF